jgi:hypothetical protein
VDVVTAMIEQISAQLMQLAGMFAAADVTTKILVALCAVLILLLVMIAKTFMGSSKAAPASAELPLELKAEQIGGSDGRAEPVMVSKMGRVGEPSPQPVEFDAIRDAPKQAKAEVAEGVPAATDNSAETIEEDFKIFKRVALANQPPVESPAEINEDDELAIIEKNMVRLKELFHEGHITRDVYVDETRTLYHQAISILGSG